MKRVIINEVGLRDGLQSIDSIMSTADKCKWIDLSYEAGIRYMEVASFVPPKLLPQMADASEVVAHALTYPDLKVTALVPNLIGAQRALDSGIHRLIAPLSASEAHSLANVRKTPFEMIEEIHRILNLRNQSNLDTEIIAGISVAFGCTRQGHVPLKYLLNLIQLLEEINIDMVSLADTTGYATPKQVEQTIQAVKKIIGGKLRSVHFHDTRGLAIANSIIALQQGIKEFDSSLAGLGGCPYAPGASGNAVTEDLTFLIESMGYQTGINLEKLLLIREFLQTSLSNELLYGYIANAGIPKNYQSILEIFNQEKKYIGDNEYV